jgi:hypothetical protein
MELTIDKMEEICYEAIKELTKEVEIDGTNLSLVGILTNKNNPTPTNLVGLGIYSHSSKDVIILPEYV